MSLVIDQSALAQEVLPRIPTLNNEQRLAYDEITETISRGEGGMIFLDTPGGTGKTYLTNLLLANVVYCVSIVERHSASETPLPLLAAYCSFLVFNLFVLRCHVHI